MLSRSRNILARASRLAAASLAAVFLVACAPEQQPAGSGQGNPHLGDNYFVTYDGAALPYMRQLPENGEPQAIILALHGFNDYRMAFRQPALDWARHGIATYAYDQRGFGQTNSRGRWAGQARLTEDLRTMSELLRERYPGKPIYLLGESMGGAVVVAAVTARQKPEHDGIILSAPATWGRENMSFTRRALLWITAHVVPSQKVSGRGLGIRPSDNIDMLRELSQDPYMIRETRVDTLYGLVQLMNTARRQLPEVEGPGLMLYGAHEQIVPRQAINISMTQFRNPENPARNVALYPDGYHMLLRDLNAPVVREDIAAWVHAPEQPLASGFVWGAQE